MVAIVATFLKVQKVAVVATLDTVAIAEIATNFALLSLKILKWIVEILVINMNIFILSCKNLISEVIMNNSLKI